jgi:hypothetical protein
MKVRLDRASHEAHLGCCLFHGQAFEVEQRNGKTLLQGEPGHGRRNVEPDHRLHVVSIRPLAIAKAMGRRPATTHPAVMVRDPVDGHPANPADWVLVLTDPAPLQVCLHECILHRIRRDFTVSGRDRQAAHESGVVSIEERIDRPQVGRCPIT